MKILSINGLRYSCKHKIVKRIREQYTLDRTIFTSSDSGNWSIGTDGDICFVLTRCQRFNDDDRVEKALSRHLVFDEFFLEFLSNADYKFLVLSGASWCLDNIFDFNLQKSGKSTSAYKSILNTKQVETIIFTQTWDNYKKCALDKLTYGGDITPITPFSDRELDKPRYDWFVPQIDNSIHTVIKEDELSEDEIYNLLIAKLK